MKKMKINEFLGSTTSDIDIVYPKYKIDGEEFTIVRIGIDQDTYHVADCDEETLSKAEYLFLKTSDGLIIHHQTTLGFSKANEKVLRSSGLGNRIDEDTFEKYRTPFDWQKKIKNAALRFVQQPEGWFAILGQSGSGKTLICNALAIALMRTGKSLKYMLWIDEINDNKFKLDVNADFIESLSEPDVLYIDDFLKKRGNTEPSNIDMELAFQILDARYRAKKTTIISSEKTITDIKRYDTAVYGRILEMAGSNMFVIQPDSRKNWREMNRIGVQT